VIYSSFLVGSCCCKNLPSVCMFLQCHFEFSFHFWFVLKLRKLYRSPTYFSTMICVHVPCPNAQPFTWP